MISLIVAYAKNRVIGNKGIIPWKIPGEQKWFKELTTDNIVIMGRKTFLEIGRPLPNRFTIVISNKEDFDGPGGCLTASSLTEAIDFACMIDPQKDVFIAGGGYTYEQAIDFVDVMYVTEIDLEVEGDTVFPEFDESKFTKEHIKDVDGEIPYTYFTYTRKPEYNEWEKRQNDDSNT